MAGRVQPGGEQADGWWLADAEEVLIRRFINGRMSLGEYRLLRLPRDIETDDIQALALELLERPDKRERLLAYEGSLRGPLMRLLRELKSKGRPDQKSRHALRQHVAAVVDAPLPSAPPDLPLSLTEQRGSEPIFVRSAVGSAVAWLVASGHPRRVGPLVAALIDRYARELRIEEHQRDSAAWDAFEAVLRGAQPHDSVEDDVRRRLDAEEGREVLLRTLGEEGTRILAHVARGRAAAEIARSLAVSDSTIRRRVRSLVDLTRTMSVRSRRALLDALGSWLDAEEKSGV